MSSLSLPFCLSAATATTEIYTLSLHDALPIWRRGRTRAGARRRGRARSLCPRAARGKDFALRSEEHTSELQSLRHLVCRLLLEKKNERGTRLTWRHLDDLIENSVRTKEDRRAT